MKKKHSLSKLLGIDHSPTDMEIVAPVVAAKKKQGKTSSRKSFRRNEQTTLGVTVLEFNKALAKGRLHDSKRI